MLAVLYITLVLITGATVYKICIITISTPNRHYTIAIYIYIIQFVCLFVCLFVRNSSKSYSTERHQTLRDNKVRLRECLTWVKVNRISVLEEISSILGFSFAADGHFINYRSLDFRLSEGLIRCRSTIDFKLGRRYSSYLPLLPAHIRQNCLWPTRCCATRHSRSPPKADALLVI